ncbi:formate/nitrite transporter family protein [Paenibacillus macquariensis]|uniref:Nitrite transporter NirC n=1 Tax=Paenibacillus macquariensis TaxID=948756 RepID=A0ABY1JKR0_9BACL|nr:formate/nitrite transporter family protein [Paenibacillus macquariensis]MEC0089984.1 formate/nitrite transporter family protein [Paenibacillus macquariensis]OAB31131.1 nitrite transporter NirC [Paenibacillus macquariensis subsp. macquariensis]SIQ35548.1 nitrite transporter NirC [Paenibacillus macquariensis]
MYTQSVETIVDSAVKKKEKMNESLIRYTIAAALAGAYVGIGIILIFTLGAPLAAIKSPFQSLIMGGSFGIALTLVIFAGSELFTGNNMFFTMSTLAGRTTVKDTLKNWSIVFIGNVLGAIVLSLLILGAGLFKGIPAEHLLFAAAAKKMHLPIMELFFRGILCNWLVCLAIWMSMRAKEEVAKLILIWWCLFAFIASGYEHSVANMTLLSIATLLPNHPETISVAGWLHNMIPVTLGNIVGGGLFVGMAYWVISPVRKIRNKT